MIRDVLIWPNQRLHEVSTAIPADELEDLELQQLIYDMYETMYEYGGVGLAAIQIGVPLRLFVMDVKQPYVFINPRIVETTGPLETFNEGCLSLPGIIEQVARYRQIKLAWTGIDGVEHEQVFTNMEAQCCQHELEHLDGIIIPDKLSPTMRARLAAKMKKASK